MWEGIKNCLKLRDVINGQSLKSLSDIQNFLLNQEKTDEFEQIELNPISKKKDF